MSVSGGYKGLVRIKFGGLVAHLPTGLEVTRGVEGIEEEEAIEGAVMEGNMAKANTEVEGMAEEATKELTVMVATTGEVEESSGGRGRGRGKGRNRPASKGQRPAKVEDPLLVQAPTTTTSMGTAASAPTAQGVARGRPRTQLPSAPRGGPRPRGALRPRGAPRPLGYSPRAPGPQTPRPRAPGSQPLLLRSPAPRAPGPRGVRPPGAPGGPRGVARARGLGPRGAGPRTPGTRPQMRTPIPQAFQDTSSPYQTSSPSPYHPPASPYPSPYSSTYSSSQEVITVEEEEPLGWPGEAATQFPLLPASITMTRVNQVRQSGCSVVDHHCTVVYITLRVKPCFSIFFMLKWFIGS